MRIGIGEHKRMDKILDYISGSNGVRINEISENVNESQSSTSQTIKNLMKLGCISQGAVKFFKKDGGEGNMKIGYFYETDLPDTLIILDRKSK